MTSHPTPLFIITFDAGKNEDFGNNVGQVLREQVRMKQGKSPQATAAIVDSQSVKTTEKKGKSTASTAVS
jgi:putative transposase